MSLALLFHYLLLNMFRMLVHPSSGVWKLLWIYFMCCIALVRCVLVLWCDSAGWCGILIKTTTHITTKHSPLNKDANAKTSILTEQYNP